MMNMKGQTAMEYLMTYGWAILIIIVVIAALYSMGVFQTPEESDVNICKDWCNDIQTEPQVDRKTAYIDNKGCVCELRIPIENLNCTDSCPI